MGDVVHRYRRVTGLHIDRRGSGPPSSVGRRFAGLVRELTHYLFRQELVSASIGHIMIQSGPARAVNPKAFILTVLPSEKFF